MAVYVSLGWGVYYFSVFDDPAVFSERLDDFGYREGEPGVFAVAAFAVLADQPPIPYEYVDQTSELVVPDGYVVLVDVEVLEPRT